MPPNRKGNQKLAWAKNDAKADGREIATETRGEGGYAVLTPSLHPSGKRYSMICGDFAHVPVIPEAVADVLLQAAKRLDQVPYTRQELVQQARRKEQERKKRTGATDNVIDKFNEENSIRDVLSHYGYTDAAQGRMSRPGKEESAGVVVADDENVCFPWSSNDPLHQPSINGTPLPIDPFEVYTFYEHDGDHKAAYIAAKQAQGNWKEATTTTVVDPETGEIHTTPSAAQVEAEQGEIFHAFTLAEWMQRKPKEWLINQIFGACDMVLIFGASGSGKTFVGLDMIFAACTGRTFATRFESARPLTCAYATSEGQDGLTNRLMAYAQHYAAMPQNLYLFDIAPQLFDAKNAENIARFIREWQVAQEQGRRPPLDLLVIDTLHGATVGADENSAQDMGIILEAARRATRLLGCAVAIIHHSNKAGTGERGSSALRGAMGCILEVKEANGYHRLECSKLKDGEAWKPISFGLVKVDGTESVRVSWGGTADRAFSLEDGKQEQNRQQLLGIMAEYPDTWFTAETIRQGLDLKPDYTRKLLNELHGKGLCQRKIGEAIGKGQKPWLFAALG